ncbi:hypothetical protein [Halodesulfovibrio marinisediminis]|uniref:Uncharacterized protein n=1 Tax=Halodesulfovibrio marinisediminis DSM 17456 TaxID=1121457 RepID=A0A1N6I0F4_9BACT|nr:hypothetical protein [Halodesulfovibrio marinisediminis]SIO25500.1 hypothetical protein SAMN02745161_2319 [Halodesulfovibrio marinisediminis DSM 17456]
MTSTTIKKRLIEALLCIFIVTNLLGCAQKTTEPPTTPTDKTSASDVAALGVLAIIAAPVALVTLPFTALSALRGEDIGLSELGLKEKYGPPTTIFTCANEFFSLWHYHHTEGPNKNVYFFISNAGYVEDVQFKNKYEGLCTPLEKVDTP